MKKSLSKFLKVGFEFVFVLGIGFAVGQLDLEAQEAASKLEVNRAELEAASLTTIEFNNYGGPYAIIETAQAIRGIGVTLGQNVAQNLYEQAVVSPGQKYSIIHAVEPQNKTKLSADILVLSEEAGVDHIKNLRRILSGYLESAYGYTTDDADTLSVFITIYNAVYRSQLEQFNGKYNDTVLKNLQPEKLGLSTNWEDWAGNTQIVIPLGELDGGLSSIDTSTISDENVVEALRETEDRGVGAREQLADLKEREATDAFENAREAQKDSIEQQKAGNKQEAAKSAKESSEQQKLADRKNQEARIEREEIKKDKELLLQEELKTVNCMTGLFVADEKKGLYTLITVNSDTGEIIKKSGVNQIRGKAVYTVSDVNALTDDGIKNFPIMYLAVCGVNDKHSAVRLCLINPDTLEVQKQSDEILSETSELIQNGTDFIAVIQDEKEWKVAVYNKDVSLKAKSLVSVKASTPLNITSKGLLVTSSSGAPVLLNLLDLSEVWGKTNVREATSGFAK